MRRRRAVKRSAHGNRKRGHNLRAVEVKKLYRRQAILVPAAHIRTAFAQSGYAAFGSLHPRPRLIRIALIFPSIAPPKEMKNNTVQRRVSILVAVVRVRAGRQQKINNTRIA